MRRLRFAGQMTAALDMELGADAKARRKRFHERSKKDPTLGAHLAAVLSGPEAVPAEFFTEAHRERMLHG